MFRRYAIKERYNMIELSVLIPAYNEEANILKTVSDISDMLFAMQVTYEIIVIDDGSTDNTAFLVESLMARDISAIRLHQNFGKGKAIRTGIEAATGKYIAFIDADGQIDPQHISKFYDLAKKYDGWCAAVIGNKYDRLSTVDYTWKRWAISKTYRLMVKLLFRFDVPDTQFGCKVFYGPTLRDICPLLKIDRFAYDIEILSWVYPDFFVESLPVTLAAPRGQGSPSVKNIFGMIKDTLKVWWEYNMGKV